MSGETCEKKNLSSSASLSRAETKSSVRKKSTKGVDLNFTRAVPLSSSGEKTTGRFFDKLSKADAFSSSMLKGKESSPRQGRSSLPSAGKKNSSLSPIRRTTNVFFDRMSKTDTYATRSMKGLSIKDKATQVIPVTPPPEKTKTTNAFFDRMSKTDTYATSTMKGKVTPPIFTPLSQDSTPARNSMTNEDYPTSVKKTTNKFFDHLSKSDTYATSTMKGKVTAVPVTSSSMNGVVGLAPVLQKKKTTNAFFDRMSKTDTYATSSMKGLLTVATITPPEQEKTTDTFFDRMSKADTYATMSMKGNVALPVSPPVEPDLPQKVTRLSFFHQLSTAETASSAQRRQALPKGGKS